MTNDNYPDGTPPHFRGEDDDFPYEDEPSEPKPCDYCGTTLVLDKDGAEYEQATDVRHYTSTCREYVHAALRAKDAQLTAERAKVEEAMKALKYVASVAAPSSLEALRARSVLEKLRGQ